MRCAALLSLLVFFVGAAAAGAAAPPASRAVTVLVSNFNTNHNGWTVLNGSWDHPDGRTIRTLGVANQWSAVVRKTQFGDFAYEARMKRTGCEGCANALVVRGRPNAAMDMKFAPALLFEYSNDGYFSVWRIKPDGSTGVVKGWTLTAVIVQGGWNTLKVEASGSTFRFYINGTKVWEQTILAPATGRVGIGMYRDNDSTGNTFRVDWARLTVSTP